MGYRAIQHTPTAKASMAYMGGRKKGPAVSKHEAGCLSTTAEVPEALLVPLYDASYPRSASQACYSSADPSDPIPYFRFCLRHLSSPNGYPTGKCLHIPLGDAGKLEICEANYPAYHHALKERYRTRHRTTGGRQSHKYARRYDAHAYPLVLKNRLD